MQLIGALWGLLGVTALIGSAIYRLTPRAVEALEMGLTAWQWTLLVAFAIFMLVAEGYRGFQKKFSPRTAARVKFLRDHPRPLHVLLAPFFCMGYFHANRKTQLTAIILTLGIIILVILVRFCEQPWRGIIDFGVVLGLSWGIVSFWIFTFKALTQKEFPHSPQVPE
ncbi:MAG: hypothetical protein KJO21_08630 [Verrucomicrobiae bacterium]|nr:hypothetical protein [Verrucomicrobiae bacterium]NNJ43539.1 hypothetical protein [Akkermansiaceae bacterium]